MKCKQQIRRGALRLDKKNVKFMLQRQCCPIPGHQAGKEGNLKRGWRARAVEIHTPTENISLDRSPPRLYSIKPIEILSIRNMRISANIVHALETTMKQAQDDPRPSVRARALQSIVSPVLRGRRHRPIFLAFFGVPRADFSIQSSAPHAAPCCRNHR